MIQDEKTKKIAAHGLVSVESCKIGRNVVTPAEPSVASTHLRRFTAHARRTTATITNTRCPTELKYIGSAFCVAVMVILN